MITTPMPADRPWPALTWVNQQFLVTCHDAPVWQSALEAGIWGKMLCETKKRVFFPPRSYHSHNGRMRWIYTFQWEIRDDLTLSTTQTADRWFRQPPHNADKLFLFRRWHHVSESEPVQTVYVWLAALWLCYAEVKRVYGCYIRNMQAAE